MTYLRGVVGLAGLSLLVLAVSILTNYWEQFKVSKVLNPSILPFRSLGSQNYKSSGRLSAKLQGLQPSGQRIPAPKPHFPWNPSQVDLPFSEFHRGPFWGCYKFIGEKDFKCVFIKKAKVWQQLWRGSMVMSIMVFIGVFFAVYMEISKKKSMKTVGTLLILSFFLSGIGLTVFVAKSPAKSSKLYSFGWSFFLGCAGAASSLIAGILGFIAKETSNKICDMEKWDTDKDKIRVQNIVKCRKNFSVEFQS